jgi:hypothetical protein
VGSEHYERYLQKIPREIRNHPTGSCVALAEVDYTHRHHQVVNTVHQEWAMKHALSKGPPVLDMTIQEASLTFVAIPNSHNLYNTITEKVQKYTDLYNE